jgi:hypothetical protein
LLGYSLYKVASSSDGKTALDGRRLPCGHSLQAHPFLREPDIFLNFFVEKEVRRGAERLLGPVYKGTSLNFVALRSV